MPTDFDDIESVDKTWVEDPPSRIPYVSLYQQPDTEEENTDKIIFITLKVIFVLGLCYCGYHMWRTQKHYKLNLEKKADEEFMRSMEMASKLQEPRISFLQPNKEGDERSTAEDMKPSDVTTENTPEVILEVTNEDKPVHRKGSLRFRDMMDKERVWETLEEKDETSENDDDNQEQDADDEEGDDTEESDANSVKNEIRRNSHKGSEIITSQIPYNKKDEECTIEPLTLTV